MTITITIDDTDAQRILDNIALIKNWGAVTLDSGRAKLAADLQNDIRQLAVNGEVQRLRDEEVKAQRQSFKAKIIAS